MSKLPWDQCIIQHKDEPIELVPHETWVTEQGFRLSIILKLLE